jgi:prepilin-type N-terminal cleavage/methylation domain-containing protein
MKSEKGVYSGFTLPELAVTVAVVGLLALASVPSIVCYMQDYRLDGVVSNLVGDLHLSRHKAIAEGNDFVVTLDPDADT